MIERIEVTQDAGQRGLYPRGPHGVPFLAHLGELGVDRIDLQRLAAEPNGKEAEASDAFGGSDSILESSYLPNTAVHPSNISCDYRLGVAVDVITALEGA